MRALTTQIALLAMLIAFTLPAHSIPAVVVEAQTLINQGQFEQALQNLDRHLNSAPEDADARFTRGLVLVRLNRNAEAIKAFSDMTRDFPQLPEPYNNLAVLHAQKGDYDKARDALESALGTHPSYGVAHENLGDIYAALAAAAYNRALTLDQDNPSVRAKLNLINQLDSLGDRRTVVADATSKPAPAKPAPVQAPPKPAPAQETPKPAPAQPAPVQAPSKPAPAIDAEGVEKFVRNWAAAWSSRNAEQYLSFYAAAFDPEDGMSKAAWEAQRRDRVTRPKSISVDVSNLRLADMGNGKVQATFSQGYESDTFKNHATKVLELSRVDGNWRIIREFTR